MATNICLMNTRGSYRLKSQMFPSRFCTDQIQSIKIVKIWLTFTDMHLALSVTSSINDNDNVAKCKQLLLVCFSYCKNIVCNICTWLSITSWWKTKQWEFLSVFCFFIKTKKKEKDDSQSFVIWMLCPIIPGNSCVTLVIFWQSVQESSI